MPEQQNIEYKQSWHDDYLKWVCGFGMAFFKDTFTFSTTDKEGGQMGSQIGGQIVFSEKDRYQPGLVERLVEGLAETQKKILRIIAGNPSSTIREMSESIGISTTEIDKKIATLKRKGIIERVGSDTKGTWKIKFPNEK